MEDASTPRQTEGVRENQVQLATDRGGTPGGSQRGKEGFSGQLVCWALRETEGGTSRPVFLGVCRRRPGGAHHDPRQLGSSEPLPHPPGRGPLRPRGARRAGAEGEEARLGK